jgi:hypothetical protein
MTMSGGSSSRFLLIQATMGCHQLYYLLLVVEVSSLSTKFEPTMRSG